MDIPPRQRTWLYLAALLGTAQPLVTFDLYALFFNHTAHTGLPTRWLAVGLVVVAVVASVAWWFERRSPSRSCRALAVSIAALGLVGAANVLAFEHYNVMMGYEVWVKTKHMPAKYAPPGMGFQLPSPDAMAPDPPDQPDQPAPG